MARIARAVVPGPPHHVTQRGNCREPVFFGAEDYQLYRRLIATAARRDGAEIWAYAPSCPSDRAGGAEEWAAAGLWRSASPLHRGHQRKGAAGPAIFSRVASARWWRTSRICWWRARYIALNPVVAGLVSHAGDWPRSSARAHLAGEDDALGTVAPLRALIPDFAAILAAPADFATAARSSWRRRSDDRWGRRN